MTQRTTGRKNFEIRMKRNRLRPIPLNTHLIVLEFEGKKMS